MLFEDSLYYAVGQVRHHKLRKGCSVSQKLYSQQWDSFNTKMHQNELIKVTCTAYRSAPVCPKRLLWILRFSSSLMWMFCWCFGLFFLPIWWMHFKKTKMSPIPNFEKYGHVFLQKTFYFDFYTLFLLTVFTTRCYFHCAGYSLYLGLNKLLNFLIMFTVDWEIIRAFNAGNCCLWESWWLRLKVVHTEKV